MQNPLAYGINWEEVAADPRLGERALLTVGCCAAAAAVAAAHVSLAAGPALVGQRQPLVHPDPGAPGGPA